MSTVENIENCAGCMSCAQICPLNAISYTNDKEGFLVPSINKSICVECGLCQKHCPQNSNVQLEDIKRIIAVRIKDSAVLKDSTSGGFFSIIANYVIDNDGVVIGCEMNQDFQAQHVAIEKKSDLCRLQGSKYLQSDINNMYSYAINNLEQGRMVLFSGTPCQIAGLKAVLKKNYSNLILIDLICHGVPSAKLFKNYIRWLENKRNAKIVKYQFRYKDGNSWGLPYRSMYILEGSKRKYITETFFDPYLYAFSNSLSLRKSCYSCKYRSDRRLGDFTIGDFWKIGQNSVKNDGKGISFVSINTDRAFAVWETVKDSSQIYLEIDDVKENDIVRFTNDECEVPYIRERIYENPEDISVFDDVIRWKPSLKNYITRYLPVSFTQYIKNIMEH